MSERIVVIGLGYVGLPVALAFARQAATIGFDISHARIDELLTGIDRTNEISLDELADTRLKLTSDPKDVAAMDPTFVVVTVPTPIDANRQPDLGPLRSATRTVASFLKQGMVVVYESTVYPGVTEEICGPLLEEISGLRSGIDFTLGYSPERINPGDKEHTLERTVKVVAGQDAATLERVASAYEVIIEAGVHRAPTIRVAEAAKVIENTQRDLNIALVNELAIIFDRLGIRTRDVLDAAGTKWNFLRFHPGLVGGHCIGVDPYYLTAKAESVGYHPEVILAGRRINDGMGTYVANRLIKLLIRSGKSIRGARVGILGLTFKEDVPDLRNSRVPDIIGELEEFGVVTLVNDPRADPTATMAQYGLELTSLEELRDLDGLMLAVPHRQYLDLPLATLLAMLSDGGAIADIKSVLDPAEIPANVAYWSL